MEIKRPQGIINGTTVSIDDQTQWDGVSGELVEDYIKTHLENDANDIAELKNKVISNIEYGSDEILHIYGANGEELAKTQVSAIEPQYEMQAYIKGVYVKKKSDSDFVLQDNKILNIKDGYKYAVGICLKYIAIRGEITSDIKATQTVSLSIGDIGLPIEARIMPNNYSELSFSEDGLINGGTPRFIDITDLISSASADNATITVSITNKEVGTITATYSGVQILNPEIYLASKTYITTDNSITFQLKGVGPALANNFTYTIFNLDVDSEPHTASTPTWNNLKDGVNRILIQGKYSADSTVITPWFSANIIKRTDELSETLVVINNVPIHQISNSAVADIYTITVFSPDKEKVNINTYINDGAIEDTESYGEPIDSVEITSDLYNSNYYYESVFKKYIELPTSGEKHLGVIWNVSSIKNNIQFNIVDSSNTPRQNYSETILVGDVDTNILPIDNQIPPQLNFSLTTGRANNVFVDLNSKLSVADTYVTRNGKTVFMLTAQETPLYEKGYIETNINGNFSFEIGLESFNISDEDEPIISLGDLQIRPTEVCWNIDYTSAPLSAEEKKAQRNDYLNKNAGFNTNEDTHIVITLQKDFSIKKGDLYYPDYLANYQDAFNSYNGTFHLLKIYINGIVLREIKLEDAKLADISSLLVINPKHSDMAISCLKVFNNYCLSEQEVRQEYIAFLPSKEDKLTFYNNNDILKLNGEISWLKSRNKFNTLVYVYPKGTKFPNRAYGGADNTTSAAEKALKEIHCSLFVNYANDAVNKEYGGRINHLQRKPQGSSAKRYFIWNVQDQLDKFKDSDGNKIESEWFKFKDLDETTNKFKEDAIATKKGILLPKDSNTVDSDGIVVSKLVGKINFASSMMSHKLGACELYNATNPTSIVGRKAVKELPYLYFYYESDNVDNILLSELISNNDDIKFMGLMTWGSGKCDKKTFDCGGDDVLIIEGAENSTPGTNFQMPWHEALRINDEGLLGNYPTCSKEESLADPELKTKFYKESIFFLEGNNLRADWDFDTNVNKDENGLDTENAKKSLLKWRAFYDFVYENDFSFESTSSISDMANWNKDKKYCVTGTNGPSLHLAYDMYRYDEIVKEWVPAGLYYTNSRWESLNLRTLVSGEDGYRSNSGIEEMRSLLKSKFKKGLADHVDITDVAHHQACVKYLSGTDNRAKNTYFKVTNNNKIILYQDDLDTIFITDNQGKQSKFYNLIEPSYDESTNEYWGDGGKNIFFRLFDRAFENEIIAQLKSVFEIVTRDNIINKYFLGIQLYFPAVSYNHTARIYYELGLLVKDSKVISEDGTILYLNNLEEPLTQSHGNYIEGEKYYLSKRNAFLQSYALNTGLDGMKLVETGGSEGTTNMSITFTLAQDLYPTVYFDNGGTKYILNGAGDYKAFKYLGKANEEYKDKVLSGDGITRVLPQVNYYKTLSMKGFANSTLAGNFDKLTSLTIDNADKGKYVESNITTIIAKFPVLEELHFNSMRVPTRFNVSEFTKIKVLDLSKCIGLEAVILPLSNNLTTITLPKSITELEINNNNSLSEINIEGYDNLDKLIISNAKILDNTKESQLKLTTLLSNITKPLSEVSFGDINNPVNIYVSELVADNLIRSKKFKIFGTLHIANENNVDIAISYNLAKYIYLNNILNISFQKTAISATIPYEISCDSIVDILDIVSVSAGNDIETALNSTNFSLVKSSGGGEIINSRFILKNLNTTNGSYRLKFAGRPSSPQTVSVLFETFKPKVGCFAYGDGTFSNIYDTVNRDLMGLVYAIDDSNGNVYIIGKDYVKALDQNTFYGGPDIGISKPSGQNDPDQLNMYNTVANINSATKSKILTITVDAKTKELGDELTTYSWGRPAPLSWFEGKENTEEIVNAAEALITSINDSKLANSNINLKYLPYYLATHLYEPEHSHELNEQYVLGNWYVPNRWELKTILEQRALSALTSTNIFSIEDLELSIKTSPTASVGGIVPIFSIASKAKANFDAWNSIGKSQNALLTSSLTESLMNSYYIKLDAYNSRGTKNYELTGGLYIPTSSWSLQNDGWCGHAHTSIPFVIFNTLK